MSATDELRRMLDERGVEYFTDDDERAYDEPARTTWDFNLCGLEMTVTAKEFVDIEGKTYLEMDFHHAFTPAQAIAATLVDDAYDAVANEHVITAEQLHALLDEWDKHPGRAATDGEMMTYATLGGGKLTAEQVRDAIRKHAHDDSCYIFEVYGEECDAIADELNAALGGGECELHECEGSFSALNRPVWRCDCGAFMTQYTDATTYHKPRFCLNCGRKAVKRMSGFWTCHECGAEMYGFENCQFCGAPKGGGEAMSMLGKQIKELREMAEAMHRRSHEIGLDYGMGRELANASRILREAADTIERLQEPQGVASESRYTELFGTPEMAARTLSPDDMSCWWCLLHDHCKDDCLIDERGRLLEWLRGDA